MRKTLVALMFLGGCFSDSPSLPEEGTSESSSDSGSSTDGFVEGTTTSTSSSSSGEEETSEEGSESSSSSESTTGFVIPEPILNHRWDGNFEDEVSGNQGVPIGDPVLVGDSFLDLDGTNHVNLSYFSDTFRETIPEGTIAIRYQNRTRGGIQAFLGLGEAGEAPEDNGFELRIGEGVFELVTETGDGVGHVAVLGDAPDDDNWHLLVVVLEGELVSTYLDNELLSDMEYVPPETQSDQLLFGASFLGHWWDGLFDDLTIWDVALSEEQIAELQ